MNNKEKILRKLVHIQTLSPQKYRKVISKYPKGNKFYSKGDLFEYYQDLVSKKRIKKDVRLERSLKMKPTRTISGVAPITVLTKPYPCPGTCIFCPTATDQPKSYLSSEPGAMRAKMLAFDPYIQTSIRIQALKNIGHTVDKIELIILGGTWSFYPKKYQLWFVIRCFEAMNDHKKIKIDSSKSIDIEKIPLQQLKNRLILAQIKNEKAQNRCVGLVVETRPDYIDDKEVKWLRFLGTTKVQLGIQTLNDSILELNKRGHTSRDTKDAVSLLRLAGFKIHAHWMCNLFGSDPKKDLEDFKKLFDDITIRPDELKIYPCILLKNTGLYEVYKKGKFKPYSTKELLELLIKCKQIIPKYCRITRLFRDIPSFEIEAGITKTNFREIVKSEMEKRNKKCECIRCREIRFNDIKEGTMKSDNMCYETSVSKEYFLSYVTPDEKLLGFLRLSIPKKKYRKAHFIKELRNSSIIREVHVYGESQSIKDEKLKIINTAKDVQHSGIGTKLLKVAEDITRKADIPNIAVISAIGTREYYRKRGFVLKDLYMHKYLIK